jgi:hypothetical protein
MNMIAVQEALDDAIRLEISAGADACSYCLVSKLTLRSIALDHMTKAGLPDDLEIDIIYPDDASTEPINPRHPPSRV